jgi:hypothetical protein
MTNAFQTSFRSTQGFPLIVELVVAAMVGFLVDVASPPADAPPAPPASETAPALVVADARPLPE